MLLTKALNIQISQTEADFIIPNIKEDRPLCIDPFLLYKSRDPYLRDLHSQLIKVFNIAFESYKKGDKADLDRLIDFPEVSEIGLGYSKGTVQGTGMGNYLNKLVNYTLANSPELVDRGIKHIEELQLVSVGIGPDRISDMAANIVKEYLIEYTQRQCNIWNIPVTAGVPVNHIFDLSDLSWKDDYVDLPINPITKYPIILVPRRIVRLLPWINFNDFARTDFQMFLAAGERKGFKSQLQGSKKLTNINKMDITAITRNEIHLLDSYVTRKESEAAAAKPELDANENWTADTPTIVEYCSRLKKITPGRKSSKNYQLEILAILNYLFEPELTDGIIEEQTIHGTERRDIIFTNEADHSFWEYIRQRYGNILVMFETKNVKTLINEHLAQTATYMGDRLGYLAFIITRQTPSKPQILKSFSIYNDSGSNRKVIIILSDEDICKMLRMKQNGYNPAKYIQQKYRDFKVKCQ
jgi:hypothetical protein